MRRHAGDVHPDKPVQFYGPEAAAFSRERLGGKWVRLEVEPNDRVDVYGRLLAYVVLEDGTRFNEELVELGYARAYTSFPCRYAARFQQLQAQARQHGRGLWVEQAARAASADGRIIGNRRSKVYHLPGQRSYGAVSEKNRVYFSSAEEAERAGFRRARN